MKNARFRQFSLVAGGSLRMLSITDKPSISSFWGMAQSSQGLVRNN